MKRSFFGMRKRGFKPTGGFGKRILCAILVLFSFVVGAQQSVAAKPVTARQSRILMGTQVDVLVRAENRAHGDMALEACFTKMERLQAKFNVYDKKSAISVINASAETSWVDLDEDLYAVFEKALDIAEASGGAFDVTVRPLIEVWGKARKEKTVPAEEEIRSALIIVGYKNLSLDRGNKRIRYRKPGMSVDLGGIAKGYVLDVGIDVLRKEGIKEALLNAGGDILTLGGKRDGPWEIGIQDPRKKGGLLGKLDVRDKAVMTSGDYERFYMHEGVRYHHILDPHTGYPARGLRSVTVVGEDGAVTDALATAVFVLGLKKGLRLIESRPGMAGAIIDDQGGRHVTPGLDGKIQWFE